MLSTLNCIIELILSMYRITCIKIKVVLLSPLLQSKGYLGCEMVCKWEGAKQTYGFRQLYLLFSRKLFKGRNVIEKSVLCTALLKLSHVVCFQCFNCFKRKEYRKIILFPFLFPSFVNSAWALLRGACSFPIFIWRKAAFRNKVTEQNRMNCDLWDIL